MSDIQTISSDDTLRDGRSRFQNDLDRLFSHRQCLRPEPAANYIPRGPHNKSSFGQYQFLKQYLRWDDPKYGIARFNQDLRLIYKGRETVDSLIRRSPLGTRGLQPVGPSEGPLSAYMSRRRGGRQFGRRGDRNDWTDDEIDDIAGSDRYHGRAQGGISPKITPRNYTEKWLFCYDFDTDYPKAKRRAYGLRSSWNEILQATSQSRLGVGEGGWKPVTCPPPISLPDLSRVTVPLLLNPDVLRYQPEFSHWRDKVSGELAEEKDLTLLRSGQVSLLYLYLRGPVYLRWHTAVQDTPEFKCRSVNPKPCKLYGQQLERYQGEVNQVEEDFAEIARVYRRDQLRGRNKVLEQSKRRAASPPPPSPASSFDATRNRYHYVPISKSDLYNRRHSDSEAFLRPTRRPLRDHSPLISSQTNSSPSKPTELKFGGMPATQVRRQQPPTEAGPSTRPQYHPTVKSQLKSGIDLEKLKSKSDAFERMATQYRAQYEQARATVEGTDEFKFGGGDCVGAVGGRCKAKGKEPMRD